MLVLAQDIMLLWAISSADGMRSLLFILLILAILLLLAGAIIAVIAFRSQRKNGPKVIVLEQVENEAGM